MADPYNDSDEKRAMAVTVADKKLRDSFFRIIEAIAIAAIIGIITMYGTSQVITAKIDYIRSDLSELRQMFVAHINSGK